MNTGVLLDASDCPLTPIPALSSARTPLKAEVIPHKRQVVDSGGSTETKTSNTSQFTPVLATKQSIGARSKTQSPDVTLSLNFCSQTTNSTPKTEVGMSQLHESDFAKSEQTKNTGSSPMAPKLTPEQHTGPTKMLQTSDAPTTASSPPSSMRVQRASSEAKSRFCRGQNSQS